MLYGAINWAPANHHLPMEIEKCSRRYRLQTSMSKYTFSYTWPVVPIRWRSMTWLKRQYLAFWSKVGTSEQPQCSLSTKCNRFDRLMQCASSTTTPFPLIGVRPSPVRPSSSSSVPDGGKSVSIGGETVTDTKVSGPTPRSHEFCMYLHA